MTWHIVVIHISLFSILKTLSYESNLYFACSSPLIGDYYVSHNVKLSPTFLFLYCILTSKHISMVNFFNLSLPVLTKSQPEFKMLYFLRLNLLCLFSRHWLCYHMSQGQGLVLLYCNNHGLQNKNIKQEDVV